MSVADLTVTDLTVTGTGILPGRLGDSSARPDGVAKVQGTFAFSGDLTADGFLWGATLRSPHPYARIVRLDVSAAWKSDGGEAIRLALAGYDATGIRSKVGIAPGVR